MDNTSEPAIKSYFFGKGYRDLGNTIREAWRSNWDAARFFIKQSKQAFLLAPLWLGAALSVFIFGTIFTLIFSLLHIVLLIFFFSLIYLAFSLIWLFESLVILLRRFMAACPECHSQLDLPVYICPSCGVEHPRLMPSSYGILWHKCRCGEQLPCSLFTNRGSLQAKCPSCQAFLNREHTETPKQFLSVIGGPSVGKSAYLFALCRHLRETSIPMMQIQANFLDAGQEKLYQKIIADMDKGIPPDKTVDTLPKALGLLLNKAEKSDSMLYLYDPAGEAFLDSQELIPHKFLGYLSGIILLVDPFAIPAVYEKYAVQLRQTDWQIRPSKTLLEDMLNRLLDVMEAEYGLSPVDKIKVPVAVVINKIDVFDLEKRIGEVALKAMPLWEQESEEQARQRLIKGRLKAWGEIPFVETLEMRCAHLRYFTVSALGHSPTIEHLAFAPQRVAEPALWILSHKQARWKICS